MTEIEQLRAALADARAVADRICEFSDGQMEDGDAARRECKALIERIDALKLAPRQTARAYFATFDNETMEVGR